MGVLPWAFLVLCGVYPFLSILWLLIQSDVPAQTTLGDTAALVSKSALQAGSSTAVTMMLGVPLALVTAVWEFRFRSVFMGLVSIPFILPTVATGLAVRGVIADSIAPGLLLVVLGHALVNLAVVLRLVGVAAEQFDERLLVQARALGVSRLRALTSIALPLIRPVLVRCAALIFSYCFSSLGLVLILGDRTVRTLETQTLRQVSLLLDFRGAAMTSAAQFLVIALVLWRGNSQRPFTAAMSSLPRPRRPLPILSWSRVYLVFIGLVVAAPLGWLLTKVFVVNGTVTLGYVLKAWKESGLRDSLVYSLGLACSVGLVTAVLSVSAAAVATERRWRRLSSVALMPLMFTSATIGLGMLLTFSREPFSWDRSGLPLIFAQSMLALPLCYVFVVGRVDAVNPHTEVVARALGTSTIRAFITAYGTALTEGACGAAGLAAAISLGEFGAASFLSDMKHPALTVLLMRQLGRPAESSFAIAAVIALVLAVTAAGAIALSQSLTRRVDRVRR